MFEPPYFEGHVSPVKIHGARVGARRLGVAVNPKAVGTHISEGPGAVGVELVCFDYGLYCGNNLAQGRAAVEREAGSDV